MNHFFNYNNPFLNNNGFGFNPNGGYNYPPFSPQNPHNMPPQPTQIATSTNTNKIYVSGIDEVKSRILPPDSDMIFIDNERDILYEKVVDSTGKFQIKMLDIVEHKDPEKSDKVADDKLSEYATKSDLEPFNALKTQYNDRLIEQENTIKALRDELKTMSEKVEAVTNIQAKMLENKGA